MTETAVYAVTIVVAALFGMFAGRVFAIEADSRLAAMWAATYVGAGVGLTSAVPIGSLLSLVAQYLQAESSTWFDAVNVAATALVWGTAAGALGGLATSIVVLGLNLGPRTRD